MEKSSVRSERDGEEVWKAGEDGSVWPTKAAPQKDEDFPSLRNGDAVIMSLRQISEKHETRASDCTDCSSPGRAGIPGVTAPTRRPMVVSWW